MKIFDKISHIASIITILIYLWLFENCFTNKNNCFEKGDISIFWNNEWKVVLWLVLFFGVIGLFWSRIVYLWKHRDRFIAQLVIMIIFFALLACMQQREILGIEFGSLISIFLVVFIFQLPEDTNG